MLRRTVLRVIIVIALLGILALQVIRVAVLRLLAGEVVTS